MEPKKLVTRREFLSTGFRGLLAALLLSIGLKSIKDKRIDPVSMSIKVRATPKMGNR